MKSLVAASFIALGICCIACKKDKNLSPDPVPSMATTSTTKEYIPMKTGAYWIYRKGDMDTTGTITYTGNSYDSVYVSGDTLINNILHYTLKHSNPAFICYYGFNFSVSTVYLNDSARYVIPYRITANQIGDTTNTQSIANTGYMVYEVPGYFSNMQTVLGTKSGLWFEFKSSSPTPMPAYYYKYFGYEAYVENIGINRYVISYASGSLNRTTYELVRYGGL